MFQLGKLKCILTLLDKLVQSSVKLVQSSVKCEPDIYYTEEVLQSESESYDMSFRLVLL